MSDEAGCPVLSSECAPIQLDSSSNNHGQSSVSFSTSTPKPRPIFLMMKQIRWMDLRFCFSEQGVRG